MNPYISNLFAEYRYSERNLAAERAASRARQLHGAGAAGAPNTCADVLALTLPGMGVRRPHWWGAIESGEPLVADSTCRDEAFPKSA